MRKLKKTAESTFAKSTLIETLYNRHREPAMLPKSLRKKYGLRLKRRKKRKQGPKPTHYKLVCISLYNQDIARLEQHVSVLRNRGHTKANKSQVIRFAIDHAPLEKMPKMY